MIIEYVDSGAGNHFKIWREVGGTRILNATGLVANGWQKTLARSGSGFSSTDFTTSSNIAGRVCPTNVFLDYDNMVATGRCLYFDGGSGKQMLDAAGTWRTETQDWLQHWNRADTGRGTSSSYFEGNIKTCADKGMRMPTMYETNMSKPGNFLPTGDGLASVPTWAGNTQGVPDTGSTTWTASAGAANIAHYFAWTGVGGGAFGYG